MQVITYLNFDGRCAEAFAFYQQIFQGELVELKTFAEAPMCNEMPAELRGKVMHAALKLGDSMIFGCDPPPGMYMKPQGFSVAVALEDVPRGERIFAALAEGGHVRMPMQETFWAKRFGDVVDRFGISWMISAGQIETKRA